MDKDKNRIGAMLALAGAAAMAVGSMMPWATVATAFGSLSVSGTEGDGKITLGVAAVVALGAFLGLTQGQKASWQYLSIIGCLVGGGVAAYDLVNISNKLGTIDSTYAHPAVGVGLYVVALGAGLGFLGVASTITSGKKSASLSGDQLSGSGGTAQPFSSTSGVTWILNGSRYLLGYTVENPLYGIWDRQSMDVPVNKYPYTEHGKLEAEARFTQLEPSSTPVLQSPAAGPSNTYGS